MPIDIKPPRLVTDESPRIIFLTHFKSIGELPISGGWGYTIDDAVIIDKNDPIVPKDIPFNGYSIESVFVEKRIYEELIIFRHEDDRHSGIEWKQLKQSLIEHDGKKFDRLTYEVTALPDKDWNELKAEYEGSNGSGLSNFDKEAHMKEYELRTVRYTAEYWFDITSFCGQMADKLTSISHDKLHTFASEDKYEENINGEKTTEINNCEATKITKANGWKRLWIVASTLYLLAIIFIIILYDKFPKKRTEDEIKATNRIVNILETDSSGYGVISKFQRSDGELQDIVIEESKLDIKNRYVFIGQMLMLWIFPCIAVYAFGLSVNWVYKGFETKSTVKTQIKSCYFYVLLMSYGLHFFS